MPTSKLTKTDQKLFRGTAAEVHGFMSNEDILNSIGCNFNVDRRPHKIDDREYPEIQIWHRSDNMDALVYSEKDANAFSQQHSLIISDNSVMQVKKKLHLILLVHLMLAKLFTWHQN